MAESTTKQLSGLENEYEISSYDSKTETIHVKRHDGVMVPVCIKDVDYRRSGQTHYYELSSEDVILYEGVQARLFVGTETSVACRCSQAKFDKWTARQLTRKDPHALEGCAHVYNTVMSK